MTARVRWSVEDVLYTCKGRIRTYTNSKLRREAVIRPVGDQWKGRLYGIPRGGGRKDLGSQMFPTLREARRAVAYWVGGRLP